MKRICATLGGQRFEIPWEGPALLSDLLAPHGFSLPCGGAHTCGACRVTAYGELSPLSAEEKRLLTTEEQLSNVRLACCARALGSCTVHALSPPRPRVRKGGTLPAAAGESPFGRGHVLAADIGTTTVAAYLCDPLRPDRPAAAGELNAQAPFGADVITRIGKCAEIGVRPLREALAGQLDRLFAGLLRGRGVRPDRVRGVVLTGNTAMLHLFAGLDPAGLAAAPYTPQSLFGVLYNARGYFSTLPPAAPVYLAPCVGAFVGADTVCALLACRLEPRELLLDVGTNGELALMTEEGALCCSAAAGPAFEGAGLRCGMVAADGAICAAAVRDGGIVCRTIGGGPPRGVCGTGAVSLLAALLELGAVDESGLLDERWEEGFPLGGGVVFTQRDIRQLQLAKAAIAAAMDALFDAAGLSPSDVKTLYIAGGFGSAIDPQAAARVGLIPAALAGRVSAAGNAAGMGACLIAASQRALDDAEALARDARVLDLTESPVFRERFVEEMIFGNPEG